MWVLFSFFSSLFIIHRSQLAISGLWPLNPVLPINFSFVSGSRYKFSESQFFFLSNHAAILAWIKKLTEKLVISGKHSKMLFFFYIDWFHSLYRAPVLRILFSLCCPPFISTQNTHTHTHTHTHTYPFSMLQSCHTSPRPSFLGSLPVEHSSKSMLLTWDP